VEKQFRGPLEGTSTHHIAISHTIRTVNITHVPVVLFHDVRFHGVVAVITEISFCWLWVHVSMETSCPSFQTNAVKLPLVLTRTSPLFSFICFGSKSQGMSFLLAVLPHMNLFYVCPSHQKVLGMKRNGP